MSAVEYNFPIEKGAIFSIAFEYKDSSNNPVNLTNWCARFSMRPLVDNPTIITYISNTTSSTHNFVIDPLVGKITLQLSASTTQSFNFNTAVYDLDLKGPNELYTGAGDYIIKLLKGSISLINSNVPTPDPFICE